MSVYVIVSGVIGALASLCAWFVTNKYWTPKLKIGSKISKHRTGDNKSGFKYRVKFENRGKRNIIDIEVIACFRLKGLRSKFPNNWDTFYLPTSSFAYDKVAILRPASKGYPQSIAEIKINNYKPFKKGYLHPDIITKANHKALTLEDVMEKHEYEFEIMILGTNEFSGTRKFFAQKFTKDDIVFGLFNEVGVDVIPDEHDQESNGTSP